VRDYYVHYRLNPEDAKTGIIQMVTAKNVVQIGSEVIKVPEATAVKFIRGGESIGEWEVRWNGEKMILTKKDMASAKEHTFWQPLFQLKYTTPTPSFDVVLDRDAGLFVVTGNPDCLEDVADDARLWVFVTKKDDPNVLYQDFFVLAGEIKYDVVCREVGDWIQGKEDFCPCSIYVRPAFKNGKFNVKWQP
jgi:hypothetical protein